MSVLWPGRRIWSVGEPDSQMHVQRYPSVTFREKSSWPEEKVIPAKSTSGSHLCFSSIFYLVTVLDDWYVYFKSTLKTSIYAREANYFHRDRQNICLYALKLGTFLAP